MWLESSLLDLYKGSIKAFPKTTKRQNSTDTVKIEHLQWIPFEGIGTLFIKSIANNEGRKNESIMLFKNVKYRSSLQKGTIPINTSNGKIIHIDRISESKNDVLVRCTCNDFFWRFNYYNSTDKSLFGRKRRKYEGQNLWEANPMKLPGLCKHLMKMAKILREANLLVVGPNI